MFPGEADQGGPCLTVLNLKALFGAQPKTTDPCPSGRKKVLPQTLGLLNLEGHERGWHEKEEEWSNQG